MKNFKKVVAGLLAVLMLALSVNVSFAAENYTAKEAEVVGKVNAAGIMTGTDKGFEPSKSLTRAEAAAIIVRMKGISESAVKATAGTTLFTDVPASHWASGYVNQASNLGIVKGVSATQFAPDREVTIAEFTTMAVRALGAGQLVDSEGTWPTNYVNFANENGLLDDVNGIYTAVATRLQAATIVANTLYAPIWEKVGVKSNGEIEWGKAGYGDTYKTILNSVLKLAEDAQAFDEISTKDNTVDSYDVEENVDLSNIKVGTVYHFYYKDNEIKGFWTENDTVEFTAITKGWKDDKITLSVDGKDKTYKVQKDNASTDADESAVYYVNEENPTAIKTLTADDYKNYKGSVVLNDKNEIETMYVTEFKNYGIVKELTKSTVKFESLVNATGYAVPTSLRFDDDEVEYFLTKDGEGMKFADLEEGDAVAWYKTSDNKKIVGEVIDTVEGKVTTIGSDYIKLGSEKVKVETFEDSIELKSDIIALTNNAGKMVAYKVVEESAADTAVISYFRAVNGKYAGDVDFEVELTYSDGTKSERLTLDKAATYNYTKAATAWNLAPVDDKDAKENAVITYILGDATEEPAVPGHDLVGTVMGYKVSGTKVTLKALSDKDHELEDYTLKVNSRTMELCADSADSYYITNDTKALKIRSIDTYSAKVEVVNVDELDSIDDEFDGYALNVNSKSEVAFVVFGTEATIKRTADTNFVFVKSVNTVSYTINEGEDDEEDVNADELVVFTMDGEEETYLYVSDEADNEELDFSSAQGTVLDLIVVDGKIMDEVSHNVSTLGKEDLIGNVSGLSPYLKEVLDTRIITTDGAAQNPAEATVLTAEKVIAVIDKSTAEKVKYELASIDDIDTFENLATLTDNDTITRVIGFTEDGETNALVVIFQDKNK